VGTSTRFPVVQLLMNPESFEQTEIEKSAVGPQAEFLLPGMKLGVEFVEGRPVHGEFLKSCCHWSLIQASTMDLPPIGIKI